MPATELACKGKSYSHLEQPICCINKHGIELIMDDISKPRCIKTGLLLLNPWLSASTLQQQQVKLRISLIGFILSSMAVMHLRI